MNRLIKQIVDAGYANRVLSETQLSRLCIGSNDSRYGLVRRALKAGDLLRVRRGLYVLAERYRSKPLHPFHLSKMLLPGSYISMETALAYHSWIPEGVFEVTSVTPGRKTEHLSHDRLGQFRFLPLALHKTGFLVGVERHMIDGEAALIASPLRALMDLVAYRKIVWSDLDWIESGLRIDREHLLALSRKNFTQLKPVYKHKATRHFLDMLEKEVLSMKERQKDRLAKVAQP